MEQQQPKRSLKRTLKKALRGENLFKWVIIIATLALILASILPYVFL